MSRNERGFVGGADGLAFGMLVLMTGSILIVSAWAVIDTRIAIDGAIREYLRSYTRADSPDGARMAANDSARAFLAGRGRNPSSVRIEHPNARWFGPCSEATVNMSVILPAARLPFVGQFGAITVSISGSEMVDTHREVTVGEDFDADDTACGR